MIFQIVSANLPDAQPDGAEKLRPIGRHDQNRRNHHMMKLLSITIQVVGLFSMMFGVVTLLTLVELLSQ